MVDAAGPDPPGGQGQESVHPEEEGAQQQAPGPRHQVEDRPARGQARQGEGAHPQVGAGDARGRSGAGGRAHQPVGPAAEDSHRAHQGQAHHEPVAEQQLAQGPDVVYMEAGLQPQRPGGQVREQGEGEEGETDHGNDRGPVAQDGGRGQEGVPAAPGGEVAAVLPQPTQAGLHRMLEGGPGPQALLHLARVHRGRRGAAGAEEAAQEGADVAAPAHGAHVVHPGEQAQPGQALDDAQAEGGAADAAAGEGEAQQGRPDRHAGIPGPRVGRDQRPPAGQEFPLGVREGLRELHGDGGKRDLGLVHDRLLARL